MSVKILTSTIISLEEFCQDPIGALSSDEESTVAVFDNNVPVLYALSPERLAQLLEIEALSQKNRIEVTTGKQLYHITTSSPDLLSIPSRKFVMYEKWRPDPDFQRQAAIWGITLNEPISTTELAAFITWWQADGRAFHHIQWQQKLARSVQRSRIIRNWSSYHDINRIPEPNQSIPDGFRGE